MERGRIEAGRDTEVTAVAEDDFQMCWKRDDLMIRNGRQQTGTDMTGRQAG